jgi:hypothetical protein
VNLLYREVDFEKEPCVFVGVHCLRWHEHPDQPTIGFVEVELEDITEVQALQARVAELEADAKLGRMVREMSEELGLYRNGPALSNLYADGRVWETIGQWGDLSEMSSERYSTPEAALEMARREEP